MNPAPQPELPPGSEFQRFDSLFRKVIAVPKAAVAKAESKRKKRSSKKRA